MKRVSITQFRKNLKKYAEMVQEQDLEIVNRNQAVFIVKGPKQNKEDAFNALMGVANQISLMKTFLRKKQSSINDQSNNFLIFVC